MGMNYRKRGKDGLNFSWSSKGPRISKSIHMGPLTFNIGKTLGQKPVLRTRMNFGSGLFFTKQHTIGKAVNSDSVQSGVNSNLSSAFNVTDVVPRMSDYIGNGDESNWYDPFLPWTAFVLMFVCFLLPIAYINQVVPFFENLTGYTLLMDHGIVKFFHAFLMAVNGLAAFLMITFLKDLAEDGFIEFLRWLIAGILSLPLMIAGLLSFLYVAGITIWIAGGWFFQFLWYLIQLAAGKT